MALVDIIIFAVIAILFAIRLFRVLGQKTGYESSSFSNLGEATVIVEVDEHQPVDVIISENVTDKVKDLQYLDPNFNLENFKMGAIEAFKIILKSFQVGDLRTLKNLLGKTVYEDFETAILERKNEKKMEK